VTPGPPWPVCTVKSECEEMASLVEEEVPSDSISHYGCCFKGHHIAHSSILMLQINVLALFPPEYQPNDAGGGGFTASSCLKGGMTPPRSRRGAASLVESTMDRMRALVARTRLL